ncbi:MAG: hypothetical protein L6R39_003781 [Caloplaca ligustica]|nr:MAG: hypothetical protein L6R39_003781 [Caloplaca ligustica]
MALDLTFDSSNPQPNGRGANHAEPEQPPMLERYLQEENRLEKFLARPAEQNTRQEERRQEQPTNEEANGRNLPDQGGQRFAILRSR